MNIKKTIAVLLMLSIVLSSCGKKDKSNDFVRVTQDDTRVVKPYDKALNDCIDILLSCSEPSQACRVAQKEDPGRSNSAHWQSCFDSKPCHEFKKSFHKARLDCFDSSVDYLKLKKACYEARLRCPKNEQRACPKSKLACDKAILAFPSLAFPFLNLNCAEYFPALSNPKYVEYSEAEKKYKDASGKVREVCYGEGADRSSSVCWEAKVEEVTLNIPYVKAQKACFELEPNDTNLS